MTREKIIALAGDVGFEICTSRKSNDSHIVDSGNIWITEKVITFYHAAQAEAFEAAANKGWEVACTSCDDQVKAAIHEMAKEKQNAD